MAAIKLPNGTLKEDQRINGARLKLVAGDWIKIICVLIAIVWGYAVLTATVNHNSTLLAEQNTDVKDNTIRSRTNEIDITIIKADIAEIKQDVKSILRMMK